MHYRCILLHIVDTYCHLLCITTTIGYYRDGRYERSYYILKNNMYWLQRERAMFPFWGREFEIAHKDIDDSVYHW